MTTPPADTGRFRIDGTLGRGGMAVVHLAYDAQLHRPVAIKILADHLAQDPDFRARFMREARMAARLSHPNIVSVFDAGEDEDERPFIVMEYVEGETLADTLAREGRLAAGRVVEVGAQCSAALAYAHAAGLVHRDIKPANLLVDVDGAIKLADFGVARALDQAQITQAGSIVGTTRYLAPEQAAGKRVTSAADVYSLGAVLYELLTGQPPYEVRSVTELVLAQRQRPVAPVRTLRPEIPAWLDTLVRACLAADPDHRPSAATLAHRLATAETDEPVTRPLPSAHLADETLKLAPAPYVRGPTPRRIRVHRPAVHPRWRWIAAAVIGLAALAVALILVADGRGRQPSTVPHPPTAPTGSTPAQHAQHLARWIHHHTG